MLQVINTAFNFMKSRIVLVLIVLVLFLGISVNVQQKLIEKKNNEIGLLNNNLTEYMSTNGGLSTEKRVLQLKLSDLSNSNNKQLHSIDSLAKALKIKPKTITNVSVIKTVIHDTLTAKVDTLYKNFDVTIKPNDLTSIQVIRKDTLLKVIPLITNEQYLYVYQDRVYRNKRKGWFDRLIHLDYKKDTIERYQVVNTNDIIKTEEVKVIKIVQ